MEKIKSACGDFEPSKIDGKIIALFEYFLRKWCEAHKGEDTAYFTDDDGNLIFEAKLIDKEG